MQHFQGVRRTATSKFLWRGEVQTAEIPIIKIGFKIEKHGNVFTCVYFEINQSNNEGTDCDKRYYFQMVGHGPPNTHQKVTILAF